MISKAENHLHNKVVLLHVCAKKYYLQSKSPIVVVDHLTSTTCSWDTILYFAPHAHALFSARGEQTIVFFSAIGCLYLAIKLP